MTCKDKDTKDVTIIVNGQKKVVPKGDLAFDTLVKLGLDNPLKGEFIVHTITYSKCQGDKPKGVLDKGCDIKVNEGMIFNVAEADKS